MRGERSTICDVRAGLQPGTTLLLLARHAESEFNAQKRFCGRSEAPLSALGRAQAQFLAQRLGGQVDHVYASRQGRALETARFVAPPQAVPGIEELDQGALEGLLFEEAVARFPDFFARWRRDPESVSEPLGETLVALRQRVGATLRELAARHDPGQRANDDAGQTLLVVGHQLAWASFLAHLRQAPAASWNRHALRNARFARLWRVGGNWFCDAGPASFDVDFPGPETVTGS